MGKEVIGIYCRVSSLNQFKEGGSIDNQRQLGIEYCKKNGLEYEIFEDVVSGNKVNRKGLDVLFGRILNGDINGILLYEWSRLIRDKRLMVKLEDILLEVKNCKVIVDGKERDILGDESDRMEYEVGGFMGSYERYRLMKRVNSGRLKSLKDGKFSGLPKYGYNQTKGIRSINKEESIIVKDIFKTFLHKNTKTIYELTKKINLKYGLKKTPKIYREMLTYKGYKGKVLLKYRGEENEVDSPIIVNDEVWDKCNIKLIDVYSKRRSSDKFNYLLKGMVFCDDCGRKMYKKGSVSKNKNRQHFYYVCSSKHKSHSESKEEYIVKNKSCGGYLGNTVSFGVLDEMVWNGLFDFLLDSDTIKKQYKKKFDDNKDLGRKYVGKEKHYIDTIEKYKRLKFESYDDYKSDKISLDDYDDFKLRYEGLISDNESRLNEIKLNRESYNEENKEEVFDYLSLMKDDLEKDKKLTSFKDKKRIIDKYVSKVKVKRLGEDEYLINFIMLFNLGENNIDKETLIMS